MLGLLVGVVVIFALGSDQQSSGAEGGSSSECRVTVTADILNVRAAPGLDAEIVGKYRQNAEADASTTVQNGFRQLAENRWAADEFLEPVDGADCG
ncbi:hypothetical protein BA062_05605 [Prauserella flavalba]|uniref:SH3 domain-containing protein n=2 Tax=Prauserella flavalba TaxID=1477506 RepID=A0A318LTY5_9PSEU|nr:hypothetical protein BA062_05605 [Prauserella flavalba]